MANIIKLKSKKLRGFTLMEFIVSIFIISVIVTVISAIFGQSINSYKNARTLQRNLENGQFAINLISKTLRTSTIVKMNNAVHTIRGFDYSQNSCVEYVFRNSGDIEFYKEIRHDDWDDEVEKCKTFPGFDPPEIIFESSSARVKIASESEMSVSPDDPSGNNQVGKVTIMLEVCEDECSIGTSNEESGVTRVQTTVSLRDYQYSGI